LARLEAQGESAHALLRDVHAHVCGRPGTPGLTERMAKVEQRQNLFTKIFATVSTALVGLAVWLVRER
jgi:hypothetical protein